MGLFKRVGDGIKYVIYGGTAYDIIPTWQTTTPSYPISNFLGNVLHGYRKSELIFTCISKKAEMCAAPRLLVYDKKTNKELPDHPLRQLIKRPNPYMTEFDFFAWCVMMFDLAGRAYFEKVRSGAGRIVQMWPLRVDWVKPIPSADKFIGVYEYWVPGRERAFLDPDTILDFKIPDPLNMYEGLAPTSVAGRVGDVDNAATDYLKLFFEKGAVPPGYIKTTQKLDDKVRKKMQKRFTEWYGGFRNWLTPLVLDRDADYERMGLTGKEMQFEKLDARSESRICMVLKVPPILIGAKVGLDRSTFSNSESAQKFMWFNTMQPIFKRIADELNNDLAPNFGSNIELRWDFSQVAALQEELNEVWKRNTEAFKAGGITRNDMRAALGLPLDATGDVYLRPLNVEEVPAKILRKSGSHDHSLKALSTPQNAPDDDIRRKYEKKLRDATLKFFNGQKGRIIKEIGDNG
jgi:HK97 family phage portal protein